MIKRVVFYLFVLLCIYVLYVLLKSLRLKSSPPLPAPLLTAGKTCYPSVLYNTMYRFVTSTEVTKLVIHRGAVFLIYD